MPIYLEYIKQRTAPDSVILRGTRMDYRVRYKNLTMYEEMEISANSLGQLVARSEDEMRQMYSLVAIVVFAKVVTRKIFLL